MQIMAIGDKPISEPIMAFIDVHLHLSRNELKQYNVPASQLMMLILSYNPATIPPMMPSPKVQCPLC